MRGQRGWDGVGFLNVLLNIFNSGHKHCDSAFNIVYIIWIVLMTINYYYY